LPVECSPDGFSCERPIERAWRQGDDLDLLGPIGTGFRPPVNSRRWLVLSIDTGIGALLPLIQIARKRGASVSLWASSIPRGLPPDVEVATSLRASLAWADYLAVSATATGLTGLRSLLSLEADELIAVEAQALVVTDMPCGFGACMGCGVRSRRGWKLACQDGPVFPLGGLTW
jgi:dihydroorotate dehydrogenase electron transfer subunit